MEIVITVFLGILTTYIAAGILFAIYFVSKGASKIDPLMATTKKRVRLLLFPGVVATWPLLITKLFTSKN